MLRKHGHGILNMFLIAMVRGAHFTAEQDPLILASAALFILLWDQLST